LRRPASSGPAIATAVANQTGWANPDQIAARIDLPATAMTLHRSMVAAVELATSPVRSLPIILVWLLQRVIAMRAQGEAEVAIEQGETRFEGVTWVTPQQIATNQIIPLPEPARRGLVNATTDVVAATNQAVATAAHLNPTEPASREGADRPRPVGRTATDREIPIHHPNRGGSSR
jgi:hypothetical protein